ncbi:MAG: SDR family NAD(P)-dependent oxidoreductase, partial [Candidatus Rokubacteria bacterium]|nr:SDR family NAD(P)-dependent oxidoreductase [Candidatus Rokubacteria bacterium]
MQPETYLITGGAGFIGCNLAARLLGAGRRVIIFDDLSRRGACANLTWLNEQFRVEFVQGDIRRPEDVEQAFRRGRVDVVIHQAAQVAVTTSVVDPRVDFEVNALGTLNLLEAARWSGMDPVVLFASTNKVYGNLADLVIEEEPLRYRLRDLPAGIPEERPLAFHSPYGCSKGAADQYVHDYGRIYGLRTVNFRQSCIYGYRQFGVEDQGWVAWFTIAAVLGRPITIYGDGKQVRDVLFVEDLIEAYLAAVRHVERAAGQNFNIGGGPGCVMSLHELLRLLELGLGRRLEISYDQCRPGDQRVFVANVNLARRLLGWEPVVKPAEGVRRLLEWVQ